MSLALVKSILSAGGDVRTNKARYSPVCSFDDVEAGNASAASSTVSSNDNYGDEKPVRYFTTEQASSTTTRVNPRLISDATIGLSDGLTVPFALTAGLSALGDTHVVIYGGFAELIAGSISMGLGGYLGAKSEAEAYHAALAETREMVAHDRTGVKAAAMLRATFADYELPAEVVGDIAATLSTDPDRLTSFLMRFHHQLAEADYAPSKAYVSGLTIAAGYFIGGLVPLLPYLVFATVDRALMASIIVMALTLFVFGWLKTSLVGEARVVVCFRNAVQMLVLGGIAAVAAMGCVKAIGT